MIPGEVTLTTAPLVDTRVARFNRAPDGQLRIALVDTATGLEFGSFVLTERTVQAVERATAAVRAVRDKLAQGVARADERADERADPAEDKELYAYLGRVHECRGRKQQIKARAAQSCAEGRYDRAAVLRDVETTLVAPCAQSLRAQATLAGRNPPTHNAATLASVAESFVRRIESELFEEERRKCAPAPVQAVEATHHDAPRGLSSGVSIGHLFSLNVKRWEQANRNVATLQKQRSFRSNKDRQAHATALGRAQEAVNIARVSNELLSDNKIPEGEREERFKALWMNVPASAYSEAVKQ